MSFYFSVLEEAVRAIGFLNDAQFTWFGVASDALSPAVRQAITPETTQGFLRHELQQTLYSQFYTKGTPRPYAQEAGWVPDDLSFVATLAAANQCKDSLENGWTAREFRDGRIVVDRRGLSLEVPPEVCVPPVAEPLTSPIQVSLRAPSARPNLSPGYYLVLSNVPMPVSDGLVRLYWHLTPEGAAHWLRCTTEALNAESLPFHLKVLRSPALFTRCDAGVLYLPQSALEMARPALTDIYATVEAQLRSEVPAFTLALAPGLALAESPGSDSFGFHRCDLIAAGMVRSQAEGRTELACRMDCVLACWTEAGLQIERPYLNPGSHQIYEALRLPNRRTGAAAASMECKPTIDPSACLDVSIEIATSLAREAIWDSGRCTWLGAELLGQRVASYGTLSADVYSGTAGLGLFLAALWNVARIQEVRQAAIGAVRQALAGVEALRETNMLGLYTGALGVCWAAVRAGISLEESGLLADAVTQLRLCRDQAYRNAGEEWDLMAGQTGAILGLLWLRHALDDDSLLEWATFLGAALIAAGKRDRVGRLSWRLRPKRGAPALTGYSHGAAGAGIALLELGAAVRDDAFEEAGLAAFAYERQWYDAERANWPDFRRTGGKLHQLPYQFSTAWCHGAPGIALSRLRAMQLAPSPQIAVELRAALATTSQATAAMLDVPGTTFCLCHGLTGNAEVLSLCADEAVPSLVWRVAAYGQQTCGAGRAPWPCGPYLADVPGLMLGRAGIGHFYLRLFDPSVPSVLLPYP